VYAVCGICAAIRRGVWQRCGPGQKEVLVMLDLGAGFAGVVFLGLFRSFWA